MTADPYGPPDDDSAYERQPPNDQHAERSALGAMLISREAIDAVQAIVRGRDFYRPVHETIFDAITELHADGEPVDAVTVHDLLTRRGEVAKVGGAPYLHDLASSVPIASNADYYAQIIADKAVLRRLATVGAQIAERAYVQEGEVATIYERAVLDIMEVGGPSNGEDYVPASDVVIPVVDQMAADPNDREQGILTGFIELDALLHGLHAGQMVVIAGRPGMGKSTLAVDFMRQAAIRQEKSCAFFSLEMGREEVVKRIISAEAKVTLDKINGGLLSERDWSLIAQHTPAVMDAPIWIDDSVNLNMVQISAKARRLKAQHGLDAIFIDYLQLMSSGKRVENRQVEVSEFSRAIKVLAKELEVPVVALSQLNRGSETRSEKRPALSDLRESGAIEQDADVVMLLHRPDMYEPESSRPGEADIIVAKNRNGPIKDIAVVAQLHYSRFVNMAPEMM